jgi:exopolysaccharide biosynthesis polyprenyl glycosylphosphotransferase
MLVLADLIGLTAAFLGTAAIWGDRGPHDHVTTAAELLIFFGALPAWVLVAKLHGLYDRDEERPDHSTVDDLVGVFQVATVGVWVLLVATSVTVLPDPNLGKLATLWALVFAGVTVGRASARAVCRRSARYVQNTIVVGAGDIGQLVARKLSKHPEYGLRVVGFVDADPKERRNDLDDLVVLGEPEDLRGLIVRHSVERVVVAFSNEPATAMVDLVRELADVEVQVDVVPRLFDVLGPNATVHRVEGLPLVGLRPVRMSPSSRLLKRLFDIVVSGTALALLSPVLAFIALRIRLDSSGPVFFRQTRLGLNMREFTALKFRTMKVDTDQEEHRRYIRELAEAGVGTSANGLFKLDRSDAVTRSGRWLRKTSLDELPQLVNVFRGDMSLVGPRPCIPYETETFARHHFERFLVPAGITGLWQVTARANSTFAEALEMDVAYARGWSLGLDVRLLLRTPFQLLRQRTATA